MATILDLKEHLEKGGKIRRPSWGKSAYVFLEHDEFTDFGGFFYSNRDLLLDDWEVYGESKKKKFKITHAGLYKTRDGREAFVGTVENNTLYPIQGFIRGDKHITCWAKNGKNWDSENDADDIVSKREE